MGRSGGSWGGMTGKVGAMGLEFHEPLPHRLERGRGMVLMINILSKNKMYWGNLFCFFFPSHIPTPNPLLEFPLVIFSCSDVERGGLS